MSRTPREQLRHFLSDMYSVELQALAQLEKAPDLAEDTAFAEDLRVHHRETQRQADLVRKRLEAHGGSPSSIKDAIMKLGGKAFLFLAKAQPETPGRLLAHAYSYEAMERAGYDMLIRMAEAAEDPETVRVALAIRDEEREMMSRLERHFDAVAELSHQDTAPEDMPAEICKHVAEAHALESESVNLLEKADNIAATDTLAATYADHAERSREHARRLDQQARRLGGETSGFKDAALAAQGTQWGLFFQAQSDTPAKLAAFAYALDHLQIGGYELLIRTARLGRDEDTARLCEELLRDEREMAQRLESVFDEAVQATLEAVRV